MIVAKFFKNNNLQKNTNNKLWDASKIRAFSPIPKSVYVWVNESFFNERRARSPQIIERNLYLNKRNRKIHNQNMQSDEVKVSLYFNRK